MTYAVGGLRDQLAEQILWIREQQIDNAWIRYVSESFPSPTQPKHKRQRELVEALGNRDPVPVRMLTTLTPEVARSYARLSSSTLNRDLTDLQRMELIEITKNGDVRAKREQVLAFLPLRREPKSPVPGGTTARRRGRPRKRTQE